ncbi:hypothetical protein [Yoonia sp. 2307UL14-13]
MDKTHRKPDQITVPSKKELVAIFEDGDEQRWLQLEWMLDRHQKEGRQ